MAFRCAGLRGRWGTAFFLSTSLASAHGSAPAAAPPAKSGRAPASAAPAPSVPAAAPLPPPASQRSIGFSNLVVRVEHTDEIGVAGADFRVHILEDLRRQGVNAVGAENLVFGRDQAQSAELMLGGTITELACVAGTRAGLVSCRLGVEWQVLDVARNDVVYKVTSRSVVHDMAKDPAISVGRALVLGALSSLTSRKAFRELLPLHTTPPSANGYGAVQLRRCPAGPRAMPAASEQVLNATVLVQASDAFGSGFVIGPEGYVITAAHVVPGTAGTVRLRDGREFPATLVRADRRLDIALLRLPLPAATELPCLATKLAPATIGSDLYAIGSPASRDLSFSLARGIVSGVRLMDGVQYLQTDAAVNPGNSGGPLVSADGEATAVVSFKLVGQSMEGLAFGVPLGAGLAAMNVSLADASTSPELSSATAAPAAPRAKLLVDSTDPLPPLDAPQAPKKSFNGELFGLGGVCLGLGAVTLALGSANDSKGLKGAGWLGIVVGGGVMVGGLF